MPVKIILVVEDDPTILDLLTDYLEEEGYKVLQASNGAEALPICDHEQPHLVILDMWMPILDGWGFAKALSARPTRPPILVISASGRAQGYAQEVGAEAYLAKPFDLEQLLATIEQLLR